MITLGSRINLFQVINLRENLMKTIFANKRKVAAVLLLVKTYRGFDRERPFSSIACPRVVDKKIENDKN